MKQLDELRSYIGSTLLICGDHPHAGKTGTFVDTKKTIGGFGLVVDLDEGGGCFVFGPSEYQVIKKVRATP